MAATGTISPFPYHQFFDNNGDPAAGYKLFTYVAGTTTKQSTYSEVTLTTANANPTVLDSAGRAKIFLLPASYKFVLAPPTDTDPPVSPLWTIDNVSSVPSSNLTLDITATAGVDLLAGDVVYLSRGDVGTTAGRWYKADADNDYSSKNAFYIGMMPTDLLTGVEGTVRIAGRATGLSGLVTGTAYYVSTTAGALTSTAPGQVRLVGVADSATSLLLFQFPIPESLFPNPIPASSAENLTKMKDAFWASAFSAGQGNAAGGADTELTSFTISIPANLLIGDGDCFVIDGLWSLANNANAKTGKLQIGSGTSNTILSNAAAVAGHTVPFRLILKRRTSTTGAVYGIAFVGATGGGIVVGRQLWRRCHHQSLCSSNWRK